MTASTIALIAFAIVCAFASIPMCRIGLRAGRQLAWETKQRRARKRIPALISSEGDQRADVAAKADALSAQAKALLDLFPSDAELSLSAANGKVELIVRASGEEPNNQKAPKLSSLRLVKDPTVWH